MLALPVAAQENRSQWIDLENDPAFSGYRQFNTDENATLDASEAQESQTPQSEEPPKEEQPAAAKPAGRDMHNTIAVIDFYSDTLRNRDLNSISQVTWDLVFNTHRYRLVTRDNVIKILTEKNMLPSDPYAPKLQPAAVAEALNADFLFVGNINKIDNTYALSLHVWSARANKVLDSRSLLYDDLGKITQELPNALEGMLSKVDDYRAKVTGPAPTRHPATADAASESASTAMSDGAANADLKRQLAVQAEKIARLESRIASVKPAQDANANKEMLKRLSALESEQKALQQANEELRKQIAAIQQELNLKAQTTASADDRTTSDAAVQTTTEEKTNGDGASEQQGEAAPDATDDSNAQASAEGADAEQSTVKLSPPSSTAENGSAASDSATDQAESSPRGDSAAARKLIQQANTLEYTDPKRLELIREAYTLDPDNLESFQLLMHALCSMEKYEEAIAAGQRQIKKHDDEFVRLMTGYAQYHASEYEAARENLQEVLRLAPDNLNANFYLGLALVEIDSAAARKQLENFIQRAQGQAGQEEYLKEARKALMSLE
ncbi:hypothetical protein JXA32_02895 [Candidatus Sumerlaeota bacterium]|nr:hypothetical protein [Candidatus Sumerlaeota bacterium]